LATFNGELYAAWVGQSPNKQIWYSAWNGSTWSSQTTVPGALTTNGPALAVYNGKLYLAWTGTSSPPKVWYSSFNGNTWSGPAQEPPAAEAWSHSSPGLAVFNGSLYLDWIGHSSKHAIWYSSFNGTAWSPEASIPSSDQNQCSVAFCYQWEDNAALAGYGSRLYVSWMAFCGQGDCFKTSSYNGTTWSGPTSTPALDTDYNGLSGTAMTVYNGLLYDAYYSNYFPYILYATFNGTTWNSWTKINSSEGANPCTQPGLASYNGSLVAAWSGEAGCPNGAIDYATGP
jgi:hypothetical protein